jgi:pimeloyl-ACP methyl ester carboxylesterase
VTLLAADRPGYGQSDPLSEASWASVSSAADDVAAAIDHMVGGPSVSLVGRRVAGWRWR